MKYDERPTTGSRAMQIDRTPRLVWQYDVREGCANLWTGVGIVALLEHAVSH
jgi:hypothetical protein